MPIATGTILRQGDILGYTKRMDSSRMLHIEVYENAAQMQYSFNYDTFRTGTGPYPHVKGSMFNRRSDLINPTMFGALGGYQGRFYDHTFVLSPNYDLIAND